MGRNIIAESLRAAGIQVEVHDDHFPTDAKDEEWLSQVGTRGWIVLSKDDRIRYRAVEKHALLSAGIAAFFLSRGDLKGVEMAAIVIKAMPRIIRFIKKYRRPFIASISRAGQVSILNTAGQ